MTEAGYWQSKQLSEMSQAEWENLCDGCGKCCVVRLEDEDTGKVYMTDLSCKLLCTQSARCTDYNNRFAKVPDCVQVSPDNIEALYWMPRTCAYRLIAEGKPLPDYHHLISGSRETIHELGMSVAGAVTSELRVPERRHFAHITEWPGEDEI